MLFKKKRQQALFNKAFVVAAKEQYISGKISYEEYQKCLQAAKNKDAMTKARQKLMENGMTCGIRHWDWVGILKWFQDYFIPAMKVIIPIALMFLDSRKDTPA